VSLPSFVVGSAGSGNDHRIFWREQRELGAAQITAHSLYSALLQYLRPAALQVPCRFTISSAGLTSVKKYLQH